MIRIGNNLSDLNNSHVVPVIGGAIPPIPSVADMFACWSTFGMTAGWQNSAALIGAVGETTTGNIASVAASPYALNWAGIIPAVGANPKISDWNDQSGNASIVSQNDDPSFRPAINVTDKRFDFDGTDDYLYRADLTGGDVATVTWYAIMRTSTFGAMRPLFASGFDQNLGTRDGICLGYIDPAGRFNNAQTGGSAINNKRVQLATNTTYIISGVYDRNQAVTSDQTLLFINDSDTGVSQNESGDMAASNFELSGYGFALGRAGIEAAPQYYNGAAMHLQFHNTAHDATLRTAWYDRLAYYVTEMGWWSYLTDGGDFLTGGGDSLVDG